MPRTAIHSDRAPAAIGPYSQATRAGNLVFFSGQIPLDPATGELVAGDITAHARRAFDNLKAVCDAAGGTMDDIARVGLYLTDGWQPDVILLCCAEVARQGRRTIAAVARELIRWREAGVETGEDAERYLRRCKQREQWCAEAAEQFGIAADALTRWERSAIARWHEEWGIGREMIEEALLRAGNKTTIRYVDGILRAWRAQGITTVSAARGQGQLSGSNILATQRPAPQQPAAASAQQPLSSRDWMAMFDEEG